MKNTLAKKRNKFFTDLNLKKDNYFLISAHREENVSNESSLRELLNTLNEISKKYKRGINIADSADSLLITSSVVLAVVGITVPIALPLEIVAAVCGG